MKAAVGGQCMLNVIIIKNVKGDFVQVSSLQFHLQTIFCRSKADNTKLSLWCEWVSLPDGVTLMISRQKSQRFKHEGSSPSGSLIMRNMQNMGVKLFSISHN